MAEPSLEQVEQLLRALVTPDTNVVKQATDVLNKYLKNAGSIPVLLQLLHSSTFVEVRQLAAILMRKKIAGHWAKLKPEVQQAIKKVLLDVIVRNDSAVVRRSAGFVVSILARLLVPVNQWPELLAFLAQCTQAPQPEQREVALALLESIVEHCGDSLRPALGQLISMFDKGLQDADPRVRLAAMKASGAAVRWLQSESELTAFRALLPAMMHVIRWCLTDDRDQEVIAAFEVFEDLVETPTSVVNTCVPELVRFALEIGAARDKVDLPVRQAALTLVEWCLQYKVKPIVKAQLIGPMLHVAFAMCAEPEDDDDADDGNLTAHKFAGQLLDTIALRVPSKHVFRPSMDFVAQYLGSQDAHHRRAALVALAVMSEGCSEPMQEPSVLPQLLGPVLSGFSDPVASVREAAYIALGQMCKHLQPAILEQYALVLPAIFQSLNDAVEHVRTLSCFALEAFSDQLDASQIAPFLQPLVMHLLEAVRRSHASHEVQEVAISAISSAAAAAGKGFGPYAADVLSLMSQLMQLPPDSHPEVRCRATECVGLVSVAVGLEAVRPNVEPWMQIVLSNLGHVDLNELREYSFGFFANMAEVMKAEFVPYLAQLVPACIASASSDEGIEQVAEDDSDEDDGLEGIEADDEAGAGNTSLAVRTAFLDEKAAACHCLGAMAEQCGAAFAGYIGTVLPALLPLAQYFHDDVRHAVLTALLALAHAADAAFPAASKWAPGQPAEPLHQATRSLVDTIMPVLQQVIEQDDAMPVVATACEVLGGLAKSLGPAAVTCHLPTTVRVLSALLQRKTACMRRFDDGPDGEDDEAEEEEEQLLEACGDCIVDLAKVCGSEFEPFFRELCPRIIKYTQKTNSSSFRCLAIGTLADCSSAIGSAFTPYLPDLVPVAIRGTSDDDEEVRSNSLFLLGSLMGLAGSASQQYYPQALQAIAKALAGKNTLPSLTDNAVAALARMISANPDAVPLGQVLPVILSHLPLKEDFSENKTVYLCLVQLFQSSANQTLADNMGASLSVFARALAADTVQPELKAELSACVRAVAERHSDAFRSLVEQLPPAEVSTLRALF
eukprot:TRINITY_DN2460_c0_g1_i3.p1 TRINITY_DN2460_c0_g1~~TRINITY_DN2460_c0_g1_i3.p1  ORF type:complete len:1068 (+),score=372.31 TRINITY_DN2460_c0_g1_i3:1435-4638(+)